MSKKISKSLNTLAMKFISISFSREESLEYKNVSLATWNEVELCKKALKLKIPDDIIDKTSPHSLVQHFSRLLHKINLLPQKSKIPLLEAFHQIVVNIDVECNFQGRFAALFLTWAKGKDFDTFGTRIPTVVVDIILSYTLLQCLADEPLILQRWRNAVFWHNACCISTNFHIKHALGSPLM